MSDDRREPPPPLRSDRRTRTRPRRRRPTFRPPPSLRRRRAALNRWTLILGVLVGASAILAALLARNEDGAPIPADVGPTAPAGAAAVDVVEVIDGDTLRVEAADGSQLTVRLYGVDTPERGEACYSEARSRLRELAGDSILLLPDERLQDPGGRELRYVFTEEGVSVDAALLHEGLAIAWRRDGAFVDEFVALEDAAAAAETGCLWAG